MLRLTKFFITLPLLSLPLWTVSSGPHAGEVMGQMDALRLLAKSRAADSKCKVLPASDADELNSYLARAEVAAAARHSVSEIQSTISVGRTLGSSSTCSPATASEIGATLAAARQAMAAVRQTRTNVVADDDVPQPVERRNIRQPEPPPRRVSLAGYGRQAFAYYVERRCEYLSRRDIRAFWVAIVRRHKAALAAFGGPAVANTLRRARNQAEARSCDASSRQLVRAEYFNIARN
ncbi:hypothetical protein [Taklimakanibacter lacteus]|uniref:hypothetical protein n=1 Tax=Taklimakanibacter lacteus TaxID=2268456 RepID=UPI000E66E72A